MLEEILSNAKRACKVLSAAFTLQEIGSNEERLKDIISEAEKILSKQNATQIQTKSDAELMQEIDQMQKESQPEFRQEGNQLQSGNESKTNQRLMQ